MKTELNKLCSLANYRILRDEQIEKKGGNERYFHISQTCKLARFDKQTFSKRNYPRDNENLCQVTRPFFTEKYNE